MIINTPLRPQLTFRTRSWFVFTLIVAFGLMPWRDVDHQRQIRDLIETRDAALVSWRRAKTDFDQAKTTAAAEADVREAYFKSRAVVEEATKGQGSEQQLENAVQ